MSTSHKFFLIVGLVLAITLGVVISPGARRSLAAGSSIATPDTTGDVGLRTSLQLDSAGNPVILYYSATDSELKVLHCTDAFCLDASASITAPVSSILDPDLSLALDAIGKPVFSYRNAAAGYLAFVRCVDATDSCDGPPPTVVFPDPSPTAGKYNSLRLDSLDHPVMAYEDTGTGELKVLHCGDPECALGGESLKIPYPRPMSFSSLDLDSAGNPGISGWDDGTSSLAVVHCNDVDCDGSIGGAEDLNFPDSGTVMKDIYLKFDVFDQPVVSYYDATNGSLKLLHCNDSACAGGNDSISIVDSLGDVGRYGSLQLDALGYPVISYYDATNGNLKVLHCNDSDCLGGDESITSPDTAGDVGRDTSLQLDALGNPVISYYDATNGDLKVLHCGDPDCADTDGDGCPDAKEQQTAPGSQSSGGLRDYLNPHDYFNPSHDGQNRVDDILDVVHQYYKDDTDGNPGVAPYAMNYNPDTDRTNLGPNGWNLGAPNGQQRVDDILNIVKQYYHDCA